ncbi:unnamed protein product [Protopolystoma xenopodis]|uniref:Uncharacterized protein n=1 Tax=Protopolystoma xenopodis TaxID=117903 RepID=A0A3S5B156_9PLAT|nr:unnamed protein product [Protopolystoma xenopodis]
MTFPHQIAELGSDIIRLLHKLVNLLYQASYRLSLSYRTALDLRPVNWRVDAFSTADTFLHTLVPHLLIGLIHLFTPSAVTFAYSSSLASRLAPPVGTSSNDTSDTLSKSIPPLSNDHLPISDMKHLIQLICQPLYVYWPNLSLHNQLPPSQAANFSHTPLDTLQPSDTSALDATHSFSVQRLLPRQQSLQSLDANSSSLQERNSSSPQASTSIPD